VRCCRSQGQSGLGSSCENPVSRDFLAGTIDCPERVYGLLGSEPLATSDQTNLVVRLMDQTKRPRSLLLILVPN